MKILGLCIDQTSSAAIMVGNEIKYASSEERFSRIKSDEAYPLMAIDAGLNFCKLKPHDLDEIAIGSFEIPLKYILIGPYSNFTVSDHLKAMEKYWRPKLRGEKAPDYFELFKEKIDYSRYPFNTKLMEEFPTEFDHHDFSNQSNVKTQQFLKKTISSHLGIEHEKIVFYEQHSCHAAYALYGSPIRDDNTLIFTADAYGDGLSATISKYDATSGRIQRLKQYTANDFQLGRIYRYVTLLLKMLPAEHEFKVMGLAPYYNGSKTKEVEGILSKMQTISGMEFKFNKEVRNIYDFLEENLKIYRFDHIASGLQAFTENLLVEWIKNALINYGGSSVVFSGGVAMNIKANMEISKIPQIKKFFVCGSASDQSLCIGACFASIQDKKIIPVPLKSLNLGISCNYDDVHLHDISKKFRVSQIENLEVIVNKLLEGKIIATCLGRAEFGPRALGNRSILADPRKHENIEIINKKIKNRDFWMPFAPIVLAEYQDEIIINPKKIQCPHMTIGFDTINGKSSMPAAVHQADGTARPLIITREENPQIWEVTHIFYKKTGIPALLNTSFNIHGEPIVNNFEDAISVFERSGLDILWLDKHMIEK